MIHRFLGACGLAMLVSGCVNGDQQSGSDDNLTLEDDVFMVAPVYEPELMLLQTSEAFVSSSGRLHGGDLVAADRDIVNRLPFEIGRYHLDISATTSVYDGAGGKLEVRLYGEKVATVKVPEGPARSLSATFEVQQAGWKALQIVFVNDATAGLRDRNVQVTAIRLYKLSRPEPAYRIQSLRDDVKNANLVLVSIDTLRADHLGSYGYPRETSPFMDGLAKRGVRFANAAASSHWTAPSHATLFTGLYNRAHGVKDYPVPAKLPDSIETLAERLNAGGWQTAGFVGGRYVNARYGLNQGFSTWEEDIEPEHSFRDANTRVDQAISWIDKQDLDRPFFVFLHIYQVHAPYDPQAPYDRLWTTYTPTRDIQHPFVGGKKPSGLPTSEELAAQIALYDGDIRVTDDALSRLYTHLEATGEVWDTLFVVTSDHGEEFLEHGSGGHGQLFGETIRVPLIMHHPGLRLGGEAVVPDVIDGADVMPTLTDLLGLPEPQNISGVSRVKQMIGIPSPDATAYSSSEMTWKNRVSVLDANGHWLDGRDGSHFFELPDDFEERWDKYDDTPAATLKTYTQRAEALRATEPQGDATPVTLSEEERDALRVLGYID